VDNAPRCPHPNTTNKQQIVYLYKKTVNLFQDETCLIKSLEDSNEDLYISKVRYLDYEEDIYYDSTDYPLRSYNLLSPIVHKRNAFSHEAELRVFQQIQAVANDEKFWENTENYMGKNISCDIKILTKNIILPPTSDEKVHEKVSSLISKYKFDFKIEKSNLNNKPWY